MKALCVDDEALLLDTLEWAVRQCDEIDEVAAFDDELDALEWAEKNDADIAFLDVRMHAMSGIELAERLTSLHPNINIVFCTGHREYAVEAFSIHASGYLLKPITPKAVQNEVAHILSKKRGTSPLKVRCFGSFEVYCCGTPMSFQRTKTKELFAYLIDRRGASIRSRELCAILWNHDGDEDKYMNYLHQLFSDLRRRLKEAGVEEVLLSQPQGHSVDTKLIDCDYYRFINGNEAAVRSFTGDYMDGYAWAKSTREYLLSRM